MIRFLTIIGPGLLVAATGIGAGDLATASFAGSHLGTAVLWAVVVGALLKFIVTEGLARWQLATGTTLIEGAVGRFGKIFGWLFLPYLLLWSFFVGSALMSACGVTLYALFPVFEDAADGKIVFGILSSLVGAGLVLAGGYPLFGRIMKACIGFMFVTVIVTAVELWPGTAEVLHGLFLPSIPDIGGEGLDWTVALMGGVGGTVTILCYGYWIREENRSGRESVRTCRFDLAAAYAITALFGVAMVIIGSTVEVEGRGAGLIVSLSEQLAESLGPTAKWLFLIGAASAVFSSLLGVWQAVPYLFADIWGMLGRRGQDGDSIDTHVNTRSLPYRGYLAAIALVPVLGLFHSFRDIQKFYAVVGAWFIPIMALALLIMNGRKEWVGMGFKNRPATVISLLAVVVFFTWIALKTF